MKYFEEVPLFVRSASRVMKDKEREDRKKSHGLSKASAAIATALPQAPREPPRNPAAQSVTAKTEAAIQAFEPKFNATSIMLPVSQSVAVASAMVQSLMPKAIGVEAIEQSCFAQSVDIGLETWPLVISLVINLLTVMVMCGSLRPQPEAHITYPKL